MQLKKEMPPEVGAKTLDQVLDTVDRETLLKRFSSVRTEATKLDAERDRLRKYIQDKVPAGQYGSTILTFKPAGTRQYANSQGLTALQTAVIIVPTHQSEHTFEPGEEVTVRNKAGEIVWRGHVLDNLSLYTESETRNIQVTELPEF